MATFLIKADPSDYGWDDLVREKRTAWTGVTSAPAQLHMRAIAKGDEVLIYHSGDQKRIVGLARAVRGAYPDPDKPGTTAAGHPKFVLVDLAPVRPAKTPTATLAAIKGDERFAGLGLVKQSRLSVMPVPPDLDKPLRTLAGL